MTERERDTVALLLAAGVPGSERLAAKVVTMRVVSRCECGCPTINFNAETHSVLAAEATVTGTDDTVLLFVDDHGELSSLEYVWIDIAPSEFPPPRSMSARARG